MVVRNAKIQGHVLDEVRQADVHLQCDTVLEGQELRRLGHRLGIP